MVKALPSMVSVFFAEQEATLDWEGGQGDQLVLSC